MLSQAVALYVFIWAWSTWKSVRFTSKRSLAHISTRWQIGWNLLLLLSHFSCVWLCATPQTATHQAPPSLGFSRQEYWSRLPFPSPMHESEKWKWSRSVVSDSLWPHGLQPTRLLRPWYSPGKSTGVGCHCLLRDWNLALYKFQIPVPLHITAQASLLLPPQQQYLVQW